MELNRRVKNIHNFQKVEKFNWLRFAFNAFVFYNFWINIELIEMELIDSTSKMLFLTRIQLKLVTRNLRNHSDVPKNYTVWFFLMRWQSSGAEHITLNIKQILIKGY